VPQTRRRGLVEWFWRSLELENARRAEHEASEPTRVRSRHALAAAELASRVLVGADPLRAEPGYWLATTLYREAAYWALLAQDETASADTLAEALAEAPRPLLLFAAGGEDQLETLQRVLLAERPALAADQDLAVQKRDARLTQQFVDALLQLRLGGARHVHRVLLQRWVRTGGALSLCVALVLGSTMLVSGMNRPPDLALGKPWRASSSAGDCRPEQRSCLGARTRILFHTRTESNPWFEVDLGEPRAFSVVEVENRDDCCPDVVLPLVLEVSEDAKQWREVARRTESFDTWRAELPPQRARYVRARAARTTALHFVRLSVIER
jgi:F5/8 type C domain